MTNNILIDDADYRLLNNLSAAPDDQIIELLVNEGKANAASFREFMEKEGLTRDAMALAILGELMDQERKETARRIKATKTVNPKWDIIPIRAFVNHNLLVEESAGTYGGQKIPAYISTLSLISDALFSKYIKEEVNIFANVYILYAKELRIQVQSIVPYDEIVSKIVHDSFMQTWYEGIEREFGFYGSFKDVLFLSAKRSILRYPTSPQKAKQREDIAFEKREEDQNVQEQILDEIRVAFSKLPPRQRAVIESLIKGRTIKEIAADFGILEKTVRTYWREAIAHVQRYIRPKNGRRWSL